jgi:glycosyltransferase involved in cell wall biosynthesis
LGRLCARWPNVQIYNSFVGAKNSRNSLTLFAPRQVFVVCNGLDLVQFKKLPVPTNGRCRIVGIGSLVQIKRWDRLLSAAMQLKQTGIDFTVEIAGSGPLRNSLQEKAQALNVQDRVKFIGHVDDVPQLLASSTFLAHTSDVEGCPNVVMEAMACGRAVIATDAGDVPALVEDGKTGFVVERGKDAKFAEQMANLISNRELCSQMGEAGRIKAEQNFGLNRFVDETLAAYRSAGWRAC